MTGLSYRATRATRWMASPPSPLLCFWFPVGGGGLFSIGAITMPNENKKQSMGARVLGDTVKVPLSQPYFNNFLGPVLGAMLKQVSWHSSRSKAYRGLPEARGQKRGSRGLESILYNTIVSQGPLAID